MVHVLVADRIPERVVHLDEIALGGVDEALREHRLASVVGVRAGRGAGAGGWAGLSAPGPPHAGGRGAPIGGTSIAGPSRAWKTAFPNGARAPSRTGWPHPQRGAPRRCDQPDAYSAPHSSG